jgi:tetratricopeptide (TPR) repeat protein
MISLVKARWRLHYHLANLFLRLHRYEQAANAYGRALRVQPGDPHLEFQRAWSLLEVPDRRAEGTTAFENLLKPSPSASGYYLMACGLQRESRHEEAVQAFREAARLEPAEHADFYFNHAISLSALRRLEDAVDRYQMPRTSIPLMARLGEAWDRRSPNWAAGKTRPPVSRKRYAPENSRFYLCEGRSVCLGDTKKPCRLLKKRSG